MWAEEDRFKTKLISEEGRISESEVQEIMSRLEVLEEAIETCEDRVDAPPLSTTSRIP